MRLAIVGVGQTLDFESGDMLDVLQVELPDGQIISVPTSNEAAQQLVRVVLGNGQSERVSPQELGRELQQTFDRAGAQDYDGPQPIGEMTPNGEVFGGGQHIGEIEVGERLPTRMQAAAGQKIVDRSAVPSNALPVSMVDEKGNPMLPAPAGLADDDDDDDPGEAL